MSIVIRSSRAEQDLDEIWDYISQDNPAAAANLLRQLNAKFLF
jgi:plasmid stabilization system protein ParE